MTTLPDSEYIVIFDEDEDTVGFASEADAVRAIIDELRDGTPADSMHLFKRVDFEVNMSVNLLEDYNDGDGPGGGETIYEDNDGGLLYETESAAPKATPGGVVVPLRAANG